MSAGVRGKPIAVPEAAFEDHPWASSLGIVWRTVGMVGTVVALSLAWVLALGMIVPLPAVTAAILRVTMASARGRSPSLLPELVAGLRESWRRATGLGVLVTLVSVVLVADLWVAEAMPGALGTAWRTALALLAAWWALVNFYLWPLVGGTGMSARSILRVSVGLSLIELPRALLAVVVGAGALLGLLAVPASIVLAGPGVVAVVWARLAWRGIRRHLDLGAAADLGDSPAERDFPTA